MVSQPESPSQLHRPDIPGEWAPGQGLRSRSRSDADRQRKAWSQSRLASALEQAARNLRCERDLPPGGRQTLIQYISYFENRKREVSERLRPISREAFQSTDEELGFTGTANPLGLAKPPDLPRRSPEVIWPSRHIVTPASA